MPGIGLHYVVFNVTASTLFLIALGLLYATLGSLNMAELSQRIAEVPPAQLTLVKATMGLLLLVFCAKAALMPLYLWLPEAYSRAPAAVAALFAIMTKVGLYSVLRIQMLWFGDDAGAMAGYGRDWLLWAGVAISITSKNTNRLKMSPVRNAPLRPTSWNWNSAWKCGARRSQPEQACSRQGVASSRVVSSIHADSRSATSAMPSRDGQSPSR